MVRWISQRFGKSDQIEDFGGEKKWYHCELRIHEESNVNLNLFTLEYADSHLERAFRRKILSQYFDQIRVFSLFFVVMFAAYFVIDGNQITITTAVTRISVVVILVILVALWQFKSVRRHLRLICVMFSLILGTGYLVLGYMTGLSMFYLPSLIWPIIYSSLISKMNPIYSLLSSLVLLGASFAVDIYALQHLATILPSVLFFIGYAYMMEVQMRRDFMLNRLYHQEKRSLLKEEVKTDGILKALMPSSIANRLKHNEQVADVFERCSVLFANIADFELLTHEFHAKKSVLFLNELFSSFDYLVGSYGMEKIKTIGSVYMVAGGIPVPRPNHLIALANLALEMQRCMRVINSRFKLNLMLKIGVHTGPCMAGVLGKKKFVYDIWGDTVNVASRMQTLCIPGHIQVTPEVYDQLHDGYVFEFRGEVEVRGKGIMRVYDLIEKKHQRKDSFRVGKIKTKLFDEVNTLTTETAESKHTLISINTMTTVTRKASASSNGTLSRTESSTRVNILKRATSSDVSIDCEGRRRSVHWDRDSLEDSLNSFGTVPCAVDVEEEDDYPEGRSSHWPGCNRPYMMGCTVQFGHGGPAPFSASIRFGKNPSEQRSRTSSMRSLPSSSSLKSDVSEDDLQALFKPAMPEVCRSGWRQRLHRLTMYMFFFITGIKVEDVPYNPLTLRFLVPEDERDYVLSLGRKWRPAILVIAVSYIVLLLCTFALEVVPALNSHDTLCYCLKLGFLPLYIAITIVLLFPPYCPSLYRWVEGLGILLALLWSIQVILLGAFSDPNYYWGLVTVMLLIICGLKLRITFSFFLGIFGWLVFKAITNLPIEYDWDNPSWPFRLDIEPNRVLSALGFMLWFCLLYLGYTAECYGRNEYWLARGLKDQHQKVLSEKEQAQALLLNVVPAEIVSSLELGRTTIADSFNEVTILFADIAGFTAWCSDRRVSEIVDMLNGLYHRFDDLVDLHKLEKIKTIGDGYMVAAGLPSPLPNHCRTCVEFALDLLRATQSYNADSNHNIQIRIGMHMGPAIAGVIGTGQKFSYDVWGETVLIASLMESSGIPGFVQVSEACYGVLQGLYPFEERLWDEAMLKSLKDSNMNCNPTRTYVLRGPVEELRVE